MSKRSEFKERADAILKENDSTGFRPKLLLHACCAPCSSYVLEHLRSHFQITVFFYNPNIYPPTEYQKRAEELKRLMGEMIPEASLIIGEYEPETFFNTVLGLETEKEGGKRCEKCFLLRLKKSAEAAKAAGCDYFTTTLTISPHKNAAVINRIGEETAKEMGIPWFPSDFKKDGGFQRSVELCAQYGLYRQDYCGCVYSVRDQKPSGKKET